MDLMHFLKANWVVLGIDAPIFSWVAAMVLIIWPIFEVLRLFYNSINIKKILSTTIERINALKKESNLRPGEGMSTSIYDKLNLLFIEIPFLAPIWSDYRNKFIRNKNNRGEDNYWSFVSSDSVFNDQTIIEQEINIRYITALPGIVTGSGLFFTFLAILVALSDLKMDNNQIVGLKLLIEGLSGKFVSSIAALFSATIFILCEIPILHSLRMKIKRLVRSTDEIVPLITAGQIAADIKQDVNEQSDAFRLFNADLSMTLKKSVNESIGPILERMVNSIDELNRLIKEAETRKESTIVDQIQTLLDNLGQSMTSSLEKMGDTFTGALSGSAKDQFLKITQSLESTATFLENMNKQSVSNQASINELISHAKTATTEQISLGQSQVMELTSVLNNLMTKLKETTGDSVSSIERTLTGITNNIYDKINNLSSQVAKTIEESTDRTTTSAKGIIEEVSTLSLKNTSNLAELLEKHKEELNRVSELDETLSVTLSDFQKSIEMYRNVSKDLGSVAKEVSVVLKSISVISGGLKQGIDSIQETSVYVTTQVEQLRGASQEQKEAWKIIQASMGKYQEVFVKVESHAKALLDQIQKNMGTYTEMTKKHVDGIVSSADDFMKDAVSRLSGSIDELKEQLDELSDTVDRMVKTLQRVR